MFGKVTDHDSFTNSPPRIFDLSLDSEDSVNNSRFNGNFQNNSNGSSTTSSSSPMSSRRDFSSPPSTPGSSTSLPLEAALALGCSFSSLLSGDSASAVSASLDKKISELERLRNKINQDSHSSASSTTSSSSTSASRSTSDRSSSESSKVNTSRYKTELCRPFSEHGTCKYGEKCQFAHGGPELRTVTRHPKYKTDLCRTYHSVGFCPYGPRCHFVHNLDEAGTEIMQGPEPQGMRQQQQQQQQQQPQQQQQHQQRQNKPIGSGRLPQHHQQQQQQLQQQQQQQQQQPQQKAIKPLPMFDNKTSFGNPTWTPLNSNLFEQQQNQGGSRNNAARLPVFSTLSK